MPQSSAQDRFELGLVMAGAVSAGAYTAGVMDFLFEALDAWADSQGTVVASRAPDEKVPELDIVVKAMAGASAGGMNAAIAAAAAHLDFTPMQLGAGESAARRNPFYHTWVDGIGISPLLGTGDLKIGKPLLSIFNTKVLETLSRDIVDFGGRVSVPTLESDARMRRTWLAEPFHLDLVVTNLQGVPYGVQFEGNTGSYHEMILHKDYMSFVVPVHETHDPATRPEAVTLGPVRSAQDEGWSLLAGSALATGAFPVALKARKLSRSPEDYNARFRIEDGASETSIVRAWPGDRERPENGVYEFFTVDGGAMNNEPFDLARLNLSTPIEEDEEPGKLHNHAIVMIDPFTDPRSSVPERTDALSAVAGQIIGAMMSQNRFRVEDLKRAAMRKTYTHFMIAPARGSLRGDQALASAGLSGFLGFFARSFRNHDFFLGRRNCQVFLAKYFTLPETHPLIKKRLTADPAFWAAHEADTVEGVTHYSVIPLVKGLDQEQPRPEWPDATDYWHKEEMIRHSVAKRVAGVLKAFKADFASPVKKQSKLMKWALDAYLWPGLSFSKARITSGIMDLLEAEVRAISNRKGQANATQPVPSPLERSGQDRPVLKRRPSQGGPQIPSL